MKLAYFVGDQHAMSQWLIKWSDNLEKESGGRIAVKRFPGSQMGPVQQHYDFARTGQADVAWFLHGATPGRFPLTEIVQLPYLVGSAEIGTKVLNDAELRAKYLDAEHKGVKVLLLLTHQPGNIHTTKKPIRTVDDMKGLRIRFSSPTIRDFVAALGGNAGRRAADRAGRAAAEGRASTACSSTTAAPASPSRWAASSSTRPRCIPTSRASASAMNQDFWNKLPPDLQELVTKSVAGRRKGSRRGLGRCSTSPARRLLMDGGGEAIKLSPPKNAKFRKIGAEVADEGEGAGRQGHAARAVTHDAVARRKARQDLENFWN